MTDIVEIVMSTLAWFLGFILSTSLYVFLVARLLPKLLLMPKYTVKSPSDRGLKKYLFKDGRAIVYKPSHNNADYIDQYILSCKNGEKSITCKIKKNVRKLRYDVSAFDLNGRLIDIVEISESVGFLGITKETELPLDTAYVLIVIKEINGADLDKYPSLTFSAYKIGIYTALCSVLTAIEFLIANRFLSHIFINIVKRSVEDNSGFTISVGLIVGIVLAATVFLMHFSKDSKIGK